MNRDTIQILNEMNRSFYQNQCQSFSDTRQSPWTGWKRCLEIFFEQKKLGALGEHKHHTLCQGQGRSDTTAAVSVFDLACGNLRYEAYLASALPRANLSFYAVDNCDDLAVSDISAAYQHVDVMEVLLQDEPLESKFSAPACDMVVAFGFMHHVPSMHFREQVLQALVSQALPGGLIFISFWQFLNNDGLAAKAQITHEQAVSELNLPPLERNDFILGWKQQPGAYRYCHSFTEEEIDTLAQSVSTQACVVDRFYADGRDESLNTYLVLRKL